MLYPALRYCRMATLLAAYLLAGFSALYAQQFDATAEQQMVQMINQERADHGLTQLVVDSRLTDAARKHTALMVERRALSHQFEGENKLPLRYADENLRSSRQSENVGMAGDVAEAHTSFMHSPPHRANILDPQLNAMGVGVLRRGPVIYVTEDFALRTPDYSEPQTDAAFQKAIESYAHSQGMGSPQRQPQRDLHRMACDMALNNALNAQAVSVLPNVHEALVWTTDDPTQLPSNVRRRLGHPILAGYSLGACFAPSVSNPAGVYWVVMVVY